MCIFFFLCIMQMCRKKSSAQIVSYQPFMFTIEGLQHLWHRIQDTIIKVLFHWIHWHCCRTLSWRRLCLGTRRWRRAWCPPREHWSGGSTALHRTESTWLWPEVSWLSPMVEECRVSEVCWEWEWWPAEQDDTSRWGYQPGSRRSSRSNNVLRGK